jgi:hypothetical protein
MELGILTLHVKKAGKECCLSTGSALFGNDLYSTTAR